ncbi:MAG TPA: Gfo/Idh/MocA family oxidoreductase [Candidatus Handelsmanbacteria bacterium]|nr:Gfo/Idh/MocA family oxidoreductase [Candidatus Handelsmanbacteria bacterium]
MSVETGFAVVGLGMGKHHCKAIDSAPNATLVAVCDVDEERLAAASHQFGCQTYKEIDDLLANDDVEVVNVATPSGSHADIGLKVAAAGKHMIVEKPADITVARIDELIAAIDAAGVKAAGIFQSRLDPLNIEIRDAVQGGRLGRMIGVHGHLPWYRKQSYYEGAHGSWKGTWAMDGGGSLMNQGVHTVDLLQWIAGRVTSVMGMFGVFDHEIEAEDQSVAILRFESGALGTLYTTTCAFPGRDQRITMYGSEGSFVKREGALESWKLLGDEDGEQEQDMLGRFGDKKVEKGSGAADPMAVSFDGHTQIIMDMVEAVQQEREPMISLHSAKHAVEIINAIYESGRTGRAVEIAG